MKVYTTQPTNQPWVLNLTSWIDSQVRNEFCRFYEWLYFLSCNKLDNCCVERIFSGFDQFKIVHVFESNHFVISQPTAMMNFSVGCLWHSHGKNLVRLYPKLQSQPIGLPKVFIDCLFFQADQSDCTKSVSIFNRFASSEERWNQNVPCQICRAWVFPLVV